MANQPEPTRLTFSEQPYKLTEKSYTALAGAAKRARRAIVKAGMELMPPDKAGREQQLRDLVLIAYGISLNAGQLFGKYPSPRTVLEWLIAFPYDQPLPSLDRPNGQIMELMSKGDLGTAGVFILAALARAGRLGQGPLKRWRKIETALLQVAQHVPHYFLTRVYAHRPPTKRTGATVGARLVSITCRVPIGVRDVRIGKRVETAPAKYLYLRFRFTSGNLEPGVNGAFGQVWIGVHQDNLYLATEFEPRGPILNIREGAFDMRAAVAATLEEKPAASYEFFPGRPGPRGQIPPAFARKLALAGLRASPEEAEAEVEEAPPPPTIAPRAIGVSEPREPAVLAMAGEGMIEEEFETQEMLSFREEDDFEQEIIAFMEPETPPEINPVTRKGLPTTAAEVNAILSGRATTYYDVLRLPRPRKVGEYARRAEKIETALEKVERHFVEGRGLSTGADGLRYLKVAHEGARVLLSRPAEYDRKVASLAQRTLNNPRSAPKTKEDRAAVGRKVRQIFREGLRGRRLDPRSPRDRAQAAAVAMDLWRRGQL